jgi:hypothetical protein
MARIRFPPELGPNEANAIRGVITAQMGAFAKGDDALAFSFADPVIQAMFETPSWFMNMVRDLYQPVYAPRAVRFGGLHSQGPRDARQEVHVVGPDGVRCVAHYELQLQNDGSWRISGCLIDPEPEST